MAESASNLADRGQGRRPLLDGVAVARGFRPLLAKCAVLILLAAGPARPSAGQASRTALSPGAFAITNVSVIPMTSETVVGDQTILVRDGRIAEVGASRSVAVPSGTHTIDVGYGFTLHRELESLVAAGLSPYEALSAATRNPAEFLHALREWGTIEAGKRADLVLLGANPLAEIRNTTRIEGVSVGGRWFERKDLQKMIEAASRRMQSLAAS
jgi:hypothetical protein